MNVERTQGRQQEQGTMKAATISATEIIAYGQCEICYGTLPISELAKLIRDTGRAAHCLCQVRERSGSPIERMDTCPVCHGGGYVLPEGWSGDEYTSQAIYDRFICPACRNGRS
jgi:hypothetical protein